MKLLSRCIIFLFAFSLLIPSPGQAFFGDFSIKDEVELGQKFNVLLRSRFPLVHDPVVVNYIRRLLQRIQAVMPPQPFSIQVEVLRDSSVNAFAAPAGYLFVHTGLILNMEHESELAAVLAHELAHVSQRHLAQNIERSKKLSLATLAGVLAGALLGQGSEVGEAVAIGSIAGGQAASLKYSREDEREADHIGLRYLVQSGYNPWGMANSFKRIKQQMLMGGSATPPDYMLTHPGLNERIGYMQDMVQNLPGSHQKPDRPDEEFRKVQTILRARYTDAHSAIRYFPDSDADLTCLERLGKGIVYERLNRITKAKELLLDSGQCSRNDALWQREMGRFHFQLGRFEPALKHLQKALQLNEDDLFALFFRARILAQQGKVKPAEEDLRRILRVVPQDPEVHEVLGRALGRAGDSFQGYLHFAYASLYRHNKSKTKDYLSKLEQLARTSQQQNKLEEFEQAFEEWSKYW